MNNPTDTGAVNPDSVVKHRKALLGTVDFTEWQARLQRFMEQQPGTTGSLEIGNIHLPSAGGSSGTLMFSATHGDGATRSTQEYVLR